MAPTNAQGLQSASVRAVITSHERDVGGIGVATQTLRDEILRPAGYDVVVPFHLSQREHLQLGSVLVARPYCLIGDLSRLIPNLSDNRVRRRHRIRAAFNAAIPVS
jgi:hypothetical protein